MKHLFYGILLALFPTLPCLAQDEDPLEKPLPKIILQTGIGLQWFGDGYKQFMISVERPASHFWHFGLQGTHYFQPQSSSSFGSEFMSGLEMGGTAKYFFHGRFSGRRTGFYIGPELRYGKRKYRYSTDNVFPLPPVPNYAYYDEKVTKIMLRWGIQYRLGHGILEISAPLGVELVGSNFPNVSSGTETKFVLLPMLSMGVAF